jgi:endoglucanase
MDKSAKNLVESVLGLPTMSFFETAPATFVRCYAEGLGLEVLEDPVGNVIVNYGDKLKPGITFNAHLDHPGFEVVEAKGKTGRVALWGRVDSDCFRGAKVIIHTSEETVAGRILKGPLPEKHLGKNCFSIEAEKEIFAGDFGYYDLPAIKFSGDRIYARAADNLMSVAAILELLTRLVEKKARARVTGLFTRGEEAGFLGAFGAMENKSVSKSAPLIVLECSSASGGGVSFGDGPVIRSGDLQSTYDPSIEAWLADCAAELAKENNKFQFQRALLKGGRCEACAYIAYGYKTGGIALPLGNYHNHGPKGPAAEYVQAKDYLNMVLLMEELVKNPMKNDFLLRKTEPIRKNYLKLRKKLMESR